MLSLNSLILAEDHHIILNSHQLKRKLNQTMDSSGGTLETEVDVVAHPTAEKLLSTCRKFFSEIDNLFAPSSSSPRNHI